MKISFPSLTQMYQPSSLTVSSGTSLHGGLANGDSLLDGLSGLGTVVGQVEHDLRLLDLGVVDGDPGTLRQEVVDEVNGGRLSGVTGVGLESESKNSNLLACRGLREMMRIS